MASIFIRTFIIYISLAAALKIMGKRQLGELEVSELVSTLLVSEIAALPIADPDIPILNAIIPVLLIVSLEIIISTLKNKHEKIKKLVEGEPKFIIYKGKLLQSTLIENRISVNELICELRLLGIGDISEAYYAILESNGKISAFKKDDKLAHNIIIDKEEIEISKQLLKYKEKWLDAELKKHKATKGEIFLMTVDDSGKTNIIKKDESHENN